MEKRNNVSRVEDKMFKQFILRNVLYRALNGVDDKNIIYVIKVEI